MATVHQTVQAVAGDLQWPAADRAHLKVINAVLSHDSFPSSHVSDSVVDEDESERATVVDRTIWLSTIVRNTDNPAAIPRYCLRVAAGLSGCRSCLRSARIPRGWLPRQIQNSGQQAGPRMVLDALPILAAAAPMGVWGVLWDVLVLLAMALLLGTTVERLGQSAIVGYLIAGTLVGPNVLGWVSTQAELFNIAELGVALLLFAIGLEFSPRRLLTLGSNVLKTGPLQVVFTAAIGVGVAIACGLVRLSECSATPSGC